MRDDWSVVAQALIKSGMRCSIITNGYRVSDCDLAKLSEMGIESVAVSLDGTKEFHDAWRMPGSFDCALSTIRRLVADGIPTSVITTLVPEGVGCLEEMFSILSGLGIAAWQLQACSPMGNASCGLSEICVDAREVIGFVEQHAESAQFRLGVADNIGYHTSSEGWIRGDLGGRACFPGCIAGLASIGIDSAGNVRGCESMYDAIFIEGNLRDVSLRDIWEDVDAFSYNRHFDASVLTGRCADCPAGVYCAGGCRSYNHFVHGKLYESPNCARVR